MQFIQQEREKEREVVKKSEMNDSKKECGRREKVRKRYRPREKKERGENEKEIERGYMLSCYIVLLSSTFFFLNVDTKICTALF